MPLIMNAIDGTIKSLVILFNGMRRIFYLMKAIMMSKISTVQNWFSYMMAITMMPSLFHSLIRETYEIMSVTKNIRNNIKPDYG